MAEELSFGMQILYGNIRAEVNKAMAMTSFNINTDAALYKKANQINLGEMKTDEVEITVGNSTYIAQGYVDGILYTEKGMWGMDDIKMIPWEAATAKVDSEPGTIVGAVSSMSGEATQAATNMADEIRSNLGEAVSSLGAKASDSLGSLSELGSDSGTTLTS